MTPASPSAQPSEDLDGIYRRLKAGEGHELVTDDNVQALIRMAEQRGDQLIEQTLREWQAPC